MIRSFRSGHAAAAFVLAAFMTLAPAAIAQEAAQPAAQEQAPAPQQAPAMTMDSGAGMLFHMIKPDRAADFEWIMEKMKAAMQKSEDPVRKQQAGGLVVLKSTDAVPNSTNVMYVVLINPAVQGADYSMQGMLKMLYEAFPEEQQEIYKRVSGAFGGPTNRVNLKPIADFSK
jgi:hypothetical protein